MPGESPTKTSPRRRNRDSARTRSLKSWCAPQSGIGQRRVHLEIHPQRLRLQRSWQHAHHLSHRLAQLQDSGLCHPRGSSRCPGLQRLFRNIFSSCTLFPATVRWSRRNSGPDRPALPHRPRRKVQSDVASAVHDPRAEIRRRPMGRIQLALRLRPRGGQCTLLRYYRPEQSLRRHLHDAQWATGDCDAGCDRDPIDRRRGVSGRLYLQRR